MSLYLSLQHHAEYFHCPKNPQQSAYSFLLLTRKTPDLLSSYYIFAFFIMLYSCNHIVMSVVFSHWLILLSNVHLRFLHFVSWLDSSFLLVLKLFYCLHVPQIICFPSEGHLGYFQILAVMNTAAINIHVQDFVWTCFNLLWVNTKGA